MNGQKSELERIVKPLLAWYDVHARALPWRMEPTPYEVWISEIMLQQTRVEAVKPYYERFRKALPTIRDLAEAPEDQVLKLWEGLGYYSRARNMQKAAQKLVLEQDGNMPADFEKIRELPGIGSYTAGAIASIAFGIAKPAVDGNVQRVLARLMAYRGDILKQSVKKWMEEQTEQVIPADRPGDFNQALIELGALVCVPNSAPRCEECPLAALCSARELGIQAELPQRSSPGARREEKRTVFVLVCGDTVVLRKRPGKGLLAGLYELPNTEGWLSEKSALEYIKGLGLSPIRIQKLPEARHIFSHVEWRMQGFWVKLEGPEMEPDRKPAKGLIFAGRDELEREYSVPAAFGAYVKCVKEDLWEGGD